MCCTRREITIWLLLSLAMRIHPIRFRQRWKKEKKRKKLKGKFPRKTACTADLFCDKCPQGNRLQRAWLALPRVIFKVIHRGEVRVKELQRWLVSPIVCLLSNLRHIGEAEMSKTEDGGDLSIPAPLPITSHSWVFMPLKYGRIKLNVDGVRPWSGILHPYYFWSFFQ